MKHHRIAAYILVLVLITGIGIPVSAKTPAVLDFSGTAACLSADLGSSGTDWLVLAACRGGADITDSQRYAYYRSVEAAVKKDGTLPVSAACKAVLTLTAAGYDPRNIADTNLLLPLADYERVLRQGITTVATALLAFDCGAYEIPQVSDACVQATREMYLEYLLSRQLEDGGWALTGQESDPDVTAMVLQALAGYRTKTAVQNAADTALEWLSGIQQADGSFVSFYNVAAAETVSQIIIALCELGISSDDTRFVKNGQTVLDALAVFAADDGQFRHTADGDTDAIATEQAFRALAAVRCRERGETLYRMTAVSAVQPGEPAQGLPGKHADITVPGISAADVTFSDIAGHESKQTILALAQRCIINGMGDDRFAPDQTMTRAQFATIVTKALGLDAQYTGTFSDVQKGTWYAAYVDTAAAYGIVNGTGNAKFTPDSTITRQEAAVMVARAAALCGLNTTFSDVQTRNVLSAFADYRTCAQWAGAALGWCYANDIMDDSALNIEPEEPVLRYEIAEMLYRMLQAAQLI